jgi:hypothetical protein
VCKNDYLCKMKTYIYTLSHPITNEIRYVGKSTRIKRRQTEHQSKWFCEKRPNHKNNWCLKLIKEGLKPILTIIDETEDNWQELEKYWIKYYKDKGFNLLNHTEGGEGQSGRKLSKEHKDKISKNNKKTNAKLTENEVILICDLILSKKCYREIKEYFPNLTEGCFYAIKCGYNWKNITATKLKFN